MGGDNIKQEKYEETYRSYLKIWCFFLQENKFHFPLKLISSEMPIGINYTAGVRSSRVL